MVQAVRARTRIPAVDLGPIGQVGEDSSAPVLNTSLPPSLHRSFKGCSVNLLIRFHLPEPPRLAGGGE